MKTIAELEEQIREVTGLLEDADARSEADSSAALAAASLRHHVDALQQQLHLEKQRRAREVIELRFRGELASFGSLPLDLLGKVSYEIARALGHVARMRYFGTEGKITKEISRTLDLRLEGISPGSTRLFISGDTAPDLFGHSLLEETLRETFAFLQSPSTNELAESAARVGDKATRALREFLRSVGHAELALDMSWEAPDEQELLWSADAREVRQLADSLNSLIPEEPEVLAVTGEIITVSARRPFELMADDGVEYSARVPEALARDIKDYRVGQRVNVAIQVKSVRNRVTGRDIKTARTLLKIANA
jgi:hypothetical protein